jgi:integrase
MLAAAALEFARLQGSTLRDAALAPATIRAYSTHYNTFLIYCRTDAMRLERMPAPRVDALLAGYMDHLYATGRPFHYAANTMHGVSFRHPRMRMLLGESRLRLRGWNRIRVTHSHPPMTWELAVVFAVTMARSGFHAHAVGLLLGFDCYLRVGELLRLQRRDVVQASDPRVGSVHPSMALRLAVTKTGREQWVSLQDTDVARVLRAWLRHTAPSSAPSDLVFPFSSSSFRRLITNTASALGLGHIPYVPHSLRHGGATADHLAGASIEQVMFRGRWKKMESARNYIQSGRALLTKLDVPHWVHRLGMLYDDDLVPIMAHLLQSTPLQGVRAASSRPGVRFRRQH